MRMRMPGVTLVAVAITLAAADLAAQQPPPPPPTQPPPAEQKQAARRRGDRSRITRADLDEAGTSVATAQDAIRILRPHWLQPPIGRTASSSMTSAGGGVTTVVIYIDGNKQNDHEVLRSLRNAELVEMRYLDQNRAVALHGPGHEAGVIEITTVNKRK